MGFQVFAYDYRGYGRSEGRPTEEGLYRDIETAYDYLIHEKKIPAQQILVLGCSLGGGPSTYWVSRRPIGGLILESTFTSIYRVAIPFSLYPFDQFPNLKRLKEVQCLILVIHGTCDEVIPLTHGETLYQSYRGKKQNLWVEGAGHNDLYKHEPMRYRKREIFSDHLKVRMTKFSYACLRC